jgi:D-alanine-D-alanine ligase
MLPKILVLYNEPTLPADHPDADSEHDILYTADTISRIVQQAGLPISRLGVTDDPAALISSLKSLAPDVVFNLYEGTARWGNAEAYVSGILELLRIPYTGCPTQPLLLCRSKPLTKQLLAGAGLPTAPFMVVDGEIPTSCSIPWPVIVKPGAEDASVGIDQDSVVTSLEQLQARVKVLQERYGPLVLIEQFVRGREFNVSMIEKNGELTTLPFSEILFVPPPEHADLWPIVSFDAKWRPGTRDFIATPAKNPAEVTPEMFHEVSTLAKKCFHLVACRDYARVDFRVNEQGQPFILEVNPNPCISPLAGLAAGLESAKIPYSEFILGLIRAGLRRGTTPELADAVSSIPVTDSAPSVVPSEAEIGRRSYRLRPAKRGDLAPICAVLERAEALSNEERVQLRDKMNDIITKRDRRGWNAHVLTAGRTLYGVVSFHPSDQSQGIYLIELISVVSEKRRQGYGIALLESAENAVRASGGRLLQVGLTSGPNGTSLRQFLTRSGYLQVGEIPDYYRDGYAKLLFAKSLPSINPEPAQAVAPVASQPG